MCDSEGDEGSSSHGVWETRVITGSEVESGSLEKDKEEKEGKRRVGRRERKGEGERRKDRREEEERKERRGREDVREGRQTKHHATCVLLSRHVTTLYVLQCRSHLPF